jgi:hypothetical protein
MVSCSGSHSQFVTAPSTNATNVQSLGGIKLRLANARIKDFDAVLALPAERPVSLARSIWCGC